MFERTSLPGWAARHLRPDAGHALALGRRDGARGLAPRASREAGLAHFMEHITFRGTAGVCRRRARSRRRSRGRWHLERSDRPGVDGLLGAAAGARGRARLPRPVGAARAAAAARRGHRPRAGHHRRGDPLLPRRSGPVRVQHVRPARSTGRYPAGLGDRGRRGVRVHRRRARHPRLLGGWLPALQHGRGRWPATWPTSAWWSWSTAGFGTGVGAPEPWLPATPAPRDRLIIERRRTAQAHLCLGLPALPRDHPDQWTLELLNAVLGEGYLVAPVPGGPRGGGPGLRRALVPVRLRGCGHAPGVRGCGPRRPVPALGRDPGGAGAAARRTGTGGRAGQGRAYVSGPPGAATRGDPQHGLLAGCPGGAPRARADPG